MKLLWLALAWTAFGAVHSVLAATATKTWATRRFPACAPAYRLAYNAFAALSLLPVLVLVYAGNDAYLWRWSGTAAWIANGLAIAALLGFVASARYYDMAEFIGLRQLRTAATAVDLPGGFVVSPFHRFVRHPWYGFGLVLLWTRDMNPPLLLSALFVTAYFIVGSRLEERKLIAQHGDAYRRYRERVPGLLPLPWKFLRADEARALMQGPRD